MNPKETCFPFSFVFAFFLSYFLKQTTHFSLATFSLFSFFLLLTLAEWVRLVAVQAFPWCRSPPPPDESSRAPQTLPRSIAGALRRSDRQTRSESLRFLRKECDDAVIIMTQDQQEVVTNCICFLCSVFEKERNDRNEDAIPVRSHHRLVVEWEEERRRRTERTEETIFWRKTYRLFVLSWSKRASVDSRFHLCQPRAKRCKERERFFDAWVPTRSKALLRSPNEKLSNGIIEGLGFTMKKKRKMCLTDRWQIGVGSVSHPSSSPAK